MNKQEIYDYGKEQGKSCVKANFCYAKNKEQLKQFAFEGEENQRQFSPFEFFAKEINESENPESQWEAYEKGVAQGIKQEVKKYF